MSPRFGRTGRIQKPVTEMRKTEGRTGLSVNMTILFQSN